MCNFISRSTYLDRGPDDGIEYVITEYISNRMFELVRANSARIIRLGDMRQVTKLSVNFIRSYECGSKIWRRRRAASLRTPFRDRFKFIIGRVPFAPCGRTVPSTSKTKTYAVSAFLFRCQFWMQLWAVAASGSIRCYGWDKGHASMTKDSRLRLQCRQKN